jgi:hypothetical protein
MYCDHPYEEVTTTLCPIVALTRKSGGGSERLRRSERSPAVTSSAGGGRLKSPLQSPKITSLVPL